MKRTQPERMEGVLLFEEFHVLPDFLKCSNWRRNISRVWNNIGI